MKDIDSLDGCLPLLFVSKYQVYPLVEMSRDVVGLESRSVAPDELVWGSLGPGGQDHVVKGLAVLLGAQVELVAVGQEVRQVEELWDQLSQVSHVVPRGRVPSVLHAVKHPVRQVEVTALEVEKVLGERLQPDHIGSHDHG